MSATQAHSGRERAHAIGELCFGGDWACAHGDLETLAYAAEQLADMTQSELRYELIALAQQCRRAPEAAAESWYRVKQLVRDSS